MVRVLNTAELLELIIAHIPIAYILSLSRVAKAWNDVVGGSPLFQTALFLQACQTAPDELHKDAQMSPGLVLTTTIGLHNASFIPMEMHQVVHQMGILINPFLSTACDLRQIPGGWICSPTALNGAKFLVQNSMLNKMLLLQPLLKLIKCAIGLASIPKE